MTKEEEMLLRQLAAGQCTIQKVVDALGPLSLWSDKALKAEIHEAVQAEREACADISDRLPRNYRETEEAHNRLSPEPYKPSQLGFDYAELRQAESITYAIRARGQA